MNKQTAASKFLVALSLLCLSPIAWGGAHTEEKAAEMDHSGHDMSASGHDMSGHDMSGHSAERDEMGRRLHGMKHNVTPEIAAELRQRIRGWENISDEEIALSMSMMGSNYAWYISDNELNSETGVLILLHGFRDRGDKIFTDQVKPYSSIFPTALAFGMSMMMSDHIQLAIDDIVAAGAKNIIVIPIVSTEHNTMIRQWQYIFGLKEDPSYATVKRIKTEANILFAEPPGDDPSVAEILLDFANEISTDPENEAVIIASHGPSEDEDNAKQLELMANLAKIVQEDGGFASVEGITLQDDAPPEVRDGNVKKLRGLVQNAVADGKQVLVVTNLIGARTIQSKLRKDLKGLDYKFNAKGLVQHDEFIEWIGETVRTTVERMPSADKT